MKRFYFIFLITSTLLFSFGFKGCVYQTIIGLILYLNFGDYAHLIDPFTGEPICDTEWVVGRDGKGAYQCRTPGLMKMNSEWIEFQSPVTEDLNFIKSFTFTNPWISNICAVGNNGAVIVIDSLDLIWEDFSIPNLNKNLYGLDYFWTSTAVRVAVCGDSGLVYMIDSITSSHTWQRVNTPTSKKLNSIVAYTYDNIVAVGEGGTIIKGGEDFGWKVIVPDSTINFTRVVKGLNENYSNLWAIGTNGSIYVSADYGYNWYPQNSGVNADLYDIKFKNAYEGIVVGANGTVRYTTNGGNSWLADSYFDGLTDGDIVSVTGVDSATAMGLIQNSSTRAEGTEIMYVSSEPLDVDDDNNIIPSEYSLEQNYPNPFNPTTNFEFRIADFGFVSLKVYDVLGREVATIVEKELTPGDYHFPFTISHFPLSSGIYFYQLKVDNKFLETKKLVLMK